MHLTGSETSFSFIEQMVVEGTWRPRRPFPALPFKKPHAVHLDNVVRTSPFCSFDVFPGAKSRVI